MTVLTPIFSSNVTLTKYKKDDRDAWLKLRRKVAGMDDLSKRIRLGGSDVATVMGMSEFQTAGGLYYEFLGLKPSREVWNQHTYRGHCLEPVVKDKYWVYFDPNDDKIEALLDNAKFNRQVRQYLDVHAIIKNKKYKYLFGDIDSYIPEQGKFNKGILEIKSMYRTALEKWEGGIPPQYVIQLQVYLMVTELEEGEIFVLADATIPYHFPFKASPEIQKNILRAVEDFCKRVHRARREIAKSTGDSDEVFAIAAKYEPEPEERALYIDFLKEQHRPENAKKPFEGDEELLNYVINYSNARMDVADIQPDIVKSEVHIRKAFVDNNTDTITFPMIREDGSLWPKITWKQKFNVQFRKFATKTN